MNTIIIGAGISGLAAAQELKRQGTDFVIIEKSSKAGGRIASEKIEGFTCDVGFQLLNPAYPAARSQLNLKSLGLQAFDRGATVWHQDKQITLADPTRAPHNAGGLLRTLKGQDARAALEFLRVPSEITLADALDKSQFSPLMDRTIRTFLAAVIADEKLSCSVSFARDLLKYFVLGSPSLPAQGMEAIVKQLLEGVKESIRFNTAVEKIIEAPAGVEVVCSDGSTLTANRVIVAADPLASSYLTGINKPATGALTTWWFATSTRPTESRYLHLDLSGQPLFNHTAVVSNIAPSYAPLGKHLVEVSATGLRNDDPQQIAARSAQILGADNADDWKLLTTHHIEHALPIIGADSNPVPKSNKITLAGDIRHASIQGALASGRKAAN